MAQKYKQIPTEFSNLSQAEQSIHSANTPYKYIVEDPLIMHGYDPNKLVDRSAQQQELARQRELAQQKEASPGRNKSSGFLSLLGYIILFFIVVGIIIGLVYVLKPDVFKNIFGSESFVSGGSVIRMFDKF